MRHATPLETPSLFTPELLSGTDAIDVIAESEERSPQILARNFVRWCWSFGTEFHNSPDINNLRFWLRKEKANTSPAEEGEILVEARRLFLKKVEQVIRKADVSKDKD